MRHFVQMHLFALALLGPGCTSSKSKAELSEAPPAAPEPSSEDGLKSEQTCDRLAADAEALLADLDRPCETGHDCRVLDTTCPFGCYRVVSMAADSGPARRAMDTYFAQCRPCKNKCLPAPKSLMCAHGRCSASPSG